MELTTITATERQWTEHIQNKYVLTSESDNKARRAWEAGGELSGGVEWRALALSSLSMWPGSLCPTTGDIKQYIDPTAAERLAAFDSGLKERWSEINDIYGRGIVLYMPRANTWEVATANSVIGDGRQLRLNEDTLTSGTIPSGSIITYWHHANPTRSTDTTSPVKRCSTAALAAASLLDAIRATSRNRSQLRPPIVYPPGTRGAVASADRKLQRQSADIRTMLNDMGRDLQNADQSSAAVNVLFEAPTIDVADKIRTLDLSGDFPEDAVAMYELCKDVVTRTFNSTVQSMDGYQSSNHWSDALDAKQSKQIYLAPAARQLSRILAPAVWSGLDTAPDNPRVGWDLDSLTIEDWNDPLSGYIGIDLSTQPNLDQVRAVLWTKAMEQNLDPAFASEYIEHIITSLDASRRCDNGQ